MGDWLNDDYINPRDIWRTKEQFKRDEKKKEEKEKVQENLRKEARKKCASKGHINNISETIILAGTPSAICERCKDGWKEVCEFHCKVCDSNKFADQDKNEYMCVCGEISIHKNHFLSQPIK